MTEGHRIEAGKRWIGEAFERICRAALGTVTMVAWEWQDEDPEYPTFKGSECPCRFFVLRALHTTRRRDPARHR
jgi:hypothetical protein